MPQEPTNVFDAAKAIVDALRDLDKQSQSLAIKFATETLGLGAQPQQHQTPTLAAAGPGPLAPPSGGGPTHSTDIKQFTAAKAPRSDQQFAAVVAYFYRFEAPESERMEAIDAGTLTEAARLAGRRRPGQARMTLNNAKKAGYLDSAGPGKFQINSVGENLVAMALPDNVSSSDAPKPRKRTNRKKAGQASSAKKSKKARKGRS